VFQIAYISSLEGLIPFLHYTHTHTLIIRMSDGHTHTLKQLSYNYINAFGNRCFYPKWFTHTFHCTSIVVSGRRLLVCVL